MAGHIFKIEAIFRLFCCLFITNHGLETWNYIVSTFSYQASLYTRQQKKFPIVQITITLKIFGRFLSNMCQIKQHIMWVHLVSFYDFIFPIDDSANSWKWPNEIARNKPSNIYFNGCLKYLPSNYTGNWYIWTL